MPSYFFDTNALVKLYHNEVHEEGSFEDFFEFDHLEAERDKIVGLVRERMI